MSDNIIGYRGLTSEDVIVLQEKYGKNELVPEKKDNIFRKILNVITEPMFLLLIFAATVYFMLGEPRDGAIMLVFVIGIISIEALQEWRTDKTLKALRDMSSPKIRVLRDGEEKTINSVELVPGDIMFVSEGIKIPADGEVIRASTLCVDESTLTGESLGVWKVTSDQYENVRGDYWREDYCYAGTMVTQGTGTIKVDKTGPSTEYGKIGENIVAAPVGDTPLQKQTGKLVKMSGVIAGILFLLVAVVTFFNIPDHDIKSRIIESILSGITLAMAMIPEEFPVILTVFMSMGAWRLAQKNSLVRKLPSVETLGAVSVLCVDKTGTITVNKMTVVELHSMKKDAEHAARIMGMGCKQDAYDPMEKAMIGYCEELGISREDLFSGKLIREYAFTDELKMMGNVWKKGNDIIVAAKGSPERILKICDLTEDELKEAQDKICQMSMKGLRVIAMGHMTVSDEKDIPEKISDCRLELTGMVGLADPPRESVKNDIELCTKAGVRVVMITGDNGITASSIARQIGMPDSDKVITGDELSAMDDEELCTRVMDVSIFSRVLPEHKMRIVKAFKSNGEVVAMTGDGVNDAPALKYADIGIAMGKRGSEVSREASDLILLDDNFSTIVDTIKDGRRIYDNIKKSIGYVFTIHIPIAFSSLLAPLLGISPASLFLLPLHVVLLELVIDPTCSIVFERQPAEADIMDRPPRNPSEKLLTAKMLTKSILQGVAVFGASFAVYYQGILMGPDNARVARTMGLSIIFIANVLLVLVNSSERELAFKTLISQAHDRIMWTVILGTFAALGVMLYTPLSSMLKLAPLSFSQMLLVLGVSFASVMWYELVKIYRYLKSR